MIDDYDRRKMKIIAAYDGSDVGKEVLGLAEQRALQTDSQVILIKSLLVPDPLKRKNSEAELSEIKNQFRKKDILCDVHVSSRGMEPGEDIVLFATENSADEIIIGIKKKSKLGKILFGSNAQFIILNAPCPVLTTRGDMKYKAQLD